MSHVVEISLSSAEGLADVVSLLAAYARREGAGEEETRWIIQSMLSQPSRVWVLYDDNHVPVGYLWAVARTSKEYQIHHLYAPRHGAVLFRAVASRLRAEGVTRLSCVVDTEARRRLFSRPPYRGQVVGYYMTCEV